MKIIISRYILFIQAFIFFGLSITDVSFAQESLKPTPLEEVQKNPERFFIFSNQDEDKSEKEPTTLERVEASPKKFFHSISCGSVDIRNLDQSANVDENGYRYHAYNLNIEPGTIAFIESNSSNFQAHVGVDTIFLSKRKKKYRGSYSRSSPNGVSYFHEGPPNKKTISVVQFYIKSQNLNKFGKYNMRVVLAKPTQSLPEDEVRDIPWSESRDSLEFYSKLSGGSLSRSSFKLPDPPGSYAKRYIKALCGNQSP